MTFRSISLVKDLSKMYVKAGYFSIRNRYKQYPRVIQLPITYQCNSKCVMCNIWQMDYSNEVTPSELEDILRDPLFKHVKAVGINGGEPTLKKDLVEFARAILTLPSLKSLNIISHGFNHKQLLAMTEEIYHECQARGVDFHISISLDGYKEIHDTVRGMKVFKLTSGAILEVQNNLPKYGDSMDVGCTVVRQNVDNLVELDTYAKSTSMNIKYRLGIPNKRIESNKLMDQFTVEETHYIQSAKEFFFSRFLEAGSFLAKFRYYAIFHHLVNPKRRLLGCEWKYRGVTLDSKGKLFYCAVESEEIGNSRSISSERNFFSEKNLKYRDSILKDKCNECIHDYSGAPTAENLTFFMKQMLFRKVWPWYYRIKGYLI